MVLFSVSNLCSLLIRLYSTCTNLDRSIVTRCDNKDANKYKYMYLPVFTFTHSAPTTRARGVHITSDDVARSFVVLCAPQAAKRTNQLSYHFRNEFPCMQLHLCGGRYMVAGNVSCMICGQMALMVMSCCVAMLCCLGM